MKKDCDDQKQGKRKKEINSDKNKVSYKLNHIGVKLVSHFKQFDPLKNFYIFSDPRGGSTWMAEILKNIPKTAFMWEPLHLKYANEFIKLGFNQRQLIPQEVEWPEAKQLFEQVFQGKTWNVFSSSMITPWELGRSNKLIVKLCRGNRMLPWISSQWEFKYVPIYMVRHPFAVVLSQINQGGWKDDFEYFRFPLSPFTDFEKKHLSFLKTLKTREEVRVAQWCISNKETMENERNDKDWIFITYEDLLLKPYETLEGIFDRWDLPVPKNVNFSKPSVTSVENFHSGDLTQLSKWQNSFDSEMIEKMLKVIEYFEIELYSASPLPIR